MPQSGPPQRAAILLLLIAVLAATRAIAALPPEAERVVAHYVEATGGRAALEAERTLYVRARVSGMGFEGLIESWSARPDHHYARTTLGPFTLAEGSDGVTDWRTDPTTGRVVRLADRDLENSRAATWFEFERWAEADHGGGSIEVASHERDSLDRYTVLAVHPPGAPDRKASRLWFSDRSGLLARMDSPHDETWITTTYADWRSAQGRLRAWVTETGLASMPANHLRSVLDSLGTQVSLASVPFAVPDSGGGLAVRWLAHEGSATLPFEYRARHVWLRVSLDGGPPEPFLLDTGASVSVLDSSYAAAHGIHGMGSMQAAGAGASGRASFTTLGSATLRGPDGDGVELRDLKVAVLSVNPTFAPLFWRDLAGILGYDVISRFVVTVDFDRGVLVFDSPRAYRHAGPDPGLPMVMNGVVPAVSATLDGRYTGLFRLDIGSSSTVDLHTPFARRYELEKRLAHPVPVSGAGFGGTFESVLGRMKRLAIGPFSWRSPMVTIARTSGGAFASEELAGNIGNRLLERFKVTFDYDGRRVWLEPGRHFGDRDALGRVGAQLERSAEGVRVTSVLPGSPADRAGLRSGDPVTEIDGRPVARWDLPELDELLEHGAEGRRLQFRVTREGRDIELLVQLREVLP